jgi:hypothetical protein
MKKKILNIFTFLFISLASAEYYDIVIYGGSSAGVIAAVQAARMHKSVILIEPGYHLGGMTANGLGFVDIGNLLTVGGLTREYFHRIWHYYQRDGAWQWEPKQLLKDQNGKTTSDDQTMWLLEPHVGEQTFEEMLAEVKVDIVLGARLDRKNGVVKQGSRILQIHMESGLSITGKVFIDATYEGDLMAAAAISYIVGRENNHQYSETLNGIHLNLNRGTVFVPIDPYQVKGSPESGLLSRVYPNAGGDEGAEDRGVQAYNYRMCLTNIPENRVMIEKPKNYNEKEYEILFRAIEAGYNKNSFFKLSRLPNGKTDSNTYGFISTDYIGMNWNYAEADYAERAKIIKEHEHWQRGLMWTLQNHPRIPESIRTFYQEWGLSYDEFQDNNHWPHQLYIREARRMISDFVLTETFATGKLKVQDGIGIASYQLDSHSVKYCVGTDGFITTEGTFFQKVPTAFPISYRAIIPKKEECENLLVPVCLSATHVAFGAVRMEPVFMILGQSAAIAASLIADMNISLQELPYEILRVEILKEGQIVDWPLTNN